MAGVRRHSALRWCSWKSSQELKVVRFRLRGTDDDIDRVLAPAEFVEPPQPGRVGPSVLSEVDLTELHDVHDSEDRRMKPSGAAFTRGCGRGASDGTEVLHVWAGTL